MLFWNWLFLTEDLQNKIGITNIRETGFNFSFHKMHLKNEKYESAINILDLLYSISVIQINRSKPVLTDSCFWT